VCAGNDVTPSEFRYTLLKFNVVLDQEYVNRIFKVFDSDNSGTIDFDEFAMWIMNSEFQPKRKLDKGETCEVVISPRTSARKKFIALYNKVR
jgi:hypothetical protein